MTALNEANGKYGQFIRASDESKIDPAVIQFLGYEIPRMLWLDHKFR